MSLRICQRRRWSRHGRGAATVSIVVLIVMVALQATVAAGRDWPQFRGPTGQGLATDGDPPASWDLANNVRWKVAVPGKGWSSPIVRGERIFLTTAVASAEEPPASHSLRVVCLDL
ncbi:MAG: PQQ-binding-like beta-propeller repeat protein, partial [Planctomycetaceae bacterium]